MSIHDLEAIWETPSAFAGDRYVAVYPSSVLPSKSTQPTTHEDGVQSREEKKEWSGDQSECRCQIRALACLPALTARNFFDDCEIQAATFEGGFSTTSASCGTVLVFVNKMGTGKKEANRRERQGKTSDGMSNVKVKGENFYRNAKKIKTLNMFKDGKAQRNAEGKVTKAASYQSRDTPKLESSPIESGSGTRE